MPLNPSEPAHPAVLFEIKAGSITLPILRLFSNEFALFGQQIQNRVKQAPEFFRYAPVVIDLHDLPPGSADIDFETLTSLLRNSDLVPVGVRGGSPAQHHAAQQAKLAVLSEAKHNVPAGAAPSPGHPPKPAAPAAPAAAKLIEQPVRSGQRIYAAGSDLIVLSQVSAGAEIMADGNIHIYNTLRGRALAGVQGDLEARIFCSDLQAELIAIGGHYKISENLDESVRHKPVQVYLRNASLIIEQL